MLRLIKCLVIGTESVDIGSLQYTVDGLLTELFLLESIQINNTLRRLHR